MFDDIDDDDGPVIFKRNVASCKQNLSHADGKKASKNIQIEKAIFNSPQGLQSYCPQNGKTVSSAPTLMEKSSPASLTSSSSSGASKVSPVLLSSQVKHPSKLDVSPHVKEENNVMESVKKEVSDSEDSDDDKPLSIRLSSGIPKEPVLCKTPSVSVDSHMLQPKAECDLDDSDDEIPLSTRFQLKSSDAPSTSKGYGSDDKKPLVSRIHSNGSLGNSHPQGKPSSVLNKRPLIDGKSLSAKKPKLPVDYTHTKIRDTPIKAEVKSEIKAEVKTEDDDNIPISQRIKKPQISGNKPLFSKEKATKIISSSFKKKVSTKKMIKESQYSKSYKVPPSSEEGQKWTTLVHSGVIFPPLYKPHGIKMLYDGKPVDLTPAQEEVATMFAVMKDSDYATKPRFIENFMGDWKRILGKNHVIKEFERCDFTPIYEWQLAEKEKKKQMSTEEKKALKEEKLKQEEKYMWAIVDGVKEKVGNFRVEPPGLFRGRGEHPKMGKLKRRICPSDITINIAKDAPIPECPVPGESWKEIKHDNTVTWLAFWNDPINTKEFKYVFLAASSSLKGQSDKEKYEKARVLKDYIDGIRAAYTKDFSSKDPTRKQISVATYLIDKLALRAGNEKDDDEADTVGCCTLKVENVRPMPPNILQFDFLGKDSIRYENEVPVELPVYKAIEQFQAGKRPGDDLFDKLDTAKLNAHLKELMPGLTAKVFRTYNASFTLDKMLHEATREGLLAEKITVYQQANKQVAIICNHQRTVSKSHSAQMSKLTEKIDKLKSIVDELKTDLARAKKGKPPLNDAEGNRKKHLSPEAIERKIVQTCKKIDDIELNMQTKEELKTVALGTSKINYCDPRITVAWCKRHEVPIEKMFNKSLLAKFAWAMDVDPEFRF